MAEPLLRELAKEIFAGISGGLPAGMVFYHLISPTSIFRDKGALLFATILVLIWGLCGFYGYFNL